MNIGFQTPNYGGIGQQTEDLFPSLDDKQKKQIEELKKSMGLSDTQAYAKIMQQKKLDDTKKKKTLAKNNAILVAETTNNTTLRKQTETIDRRDILIDKIKEFSPDNIDIDDAEIEKAAVEKYGEDNYNKYINGKISVDELFNPSPTIGSQIPGAIAAGVTLGVGKLIADKVTGRGKVIPYTPRQQPLPSKSIQKGKATILDDILSVSKTDTSIDKDAMAQTFANKFKPVQNFDELLLQSQELLKDAPGSTINKRNELITKYGKGKTFGYEYMDGLKEYRKELANDPQVTSTKLSKIDEIIAKEESFVFSKNGKITAADLEKRKEQLNNNLKRFLGKDLTVLPEADQVEQQALNKLRAGAMEKIAQLDKGTPDEGKIAALNKEYKTLLDIKEAAETQASKFKTVPQATRLKQTLSTIRKATASIWGVGYATARMESQVLKKDEKSLLKLEKNIAKANKYANKFGKVGGKLFGGLMLLGVMNELGGGGEVSADELGMTAKQKLENTVLQNQKTGGTISPSKKTLVNPKAQVFKGEQMTEGGGAPMTTYSLPIVGQGVGMVDLASQVLNWSEEKIRKFVNEFGKMDAKDKKAFEEELKTHLNK